MTKNILPPDIIDADLKWPTYEQSSRPWRVADGETQVRGGDLLSLTFYLVEGLQSRTQAGWVLTTLLISNPRRGSDASARTYAIGITDRKVYTVGKGPHVQAEVTVYLHADNVQRLQKYIDLHREGLRDAGAIRDRISTRRARGQQYRAEGRTSWRW